MTKFNNLLDTPHNLVTGFLNNHQYIAKVCSAVFRVIDKTVRIDFPLIFVATNYNITATMDAIILKSPISYGIRELSDNPIVHFIAGVAKYSILEGESLAVIYKVYNYLFTTNTSDDNLFSSFEYGEIKESCLNRTSLAIVGGLNHLAYNKDVSPYITPVLRMPGLDYSEVVAIETVDIVSQGSLKLAKSHSNKNDSAINYYDVAMDHSPFLVFGLKIGAMAYVAIKEIYLNKLLTTADLYKAAVGFVALNGINMIPVNIISEGIGYLESYNEVSLPEFNNSTLISNNESSLPEFNNITAVCKLGGYDELYKNGEL